ncbi:hypothetical protein [Streptomyces sp. NPDC020965]|uniref:hypothetical protein n=1 Tax=Streptomyces sp. NPDC020965 TaxID=3365105 RepID=UPI0037B4C851
MKNEIILTIGWIAAIQGGLAIAGEHLGDGPWGLLHLFWDVPMTVNAVILAAGLAFVLIGELGKRIRN